MHADTMGYAFTFPVVRILSGGHVPVGAYVHYPTISTDMLARVKERKESYANNAAISSSVALSSAKLLCVACKHIPITLTHTFLIAQVLPCIHVPLRLSTQTRLLPHGQLFLDEESH